ncbi:unnamed protein product [Amoebophrya sp. A25]|nr:unnamed protein product [Amoebophrya sp. A25]|eukprot:GSA25T00010632001.1
MPSLEKLHTPLSGDINLQPIKKIWLQLQIKLFRNRVASFVPVVEGEVRTGGERSEYECERKEHSWKIWISLDMDLPWVA